MAQSPNLTTYKITHSRSSVLKPVIWLLKMLVTTCGEQSSVYFVLCSGGQSTHKASLNLNSSVVLVRIFIHSACSGCSENSYGFRPSSGGEGQHQLLLQLLVLVHPESLQDVNYTALTITLCCEYQCGHPMSIVNTFYLSLCSISHDATTRCGKF